METNNFTEIKNKAIELIDIMPVGTIVRKEENIKLLLSYYKHHPNFEDKFMNGFKYFEKRKNSEWGKSNSCMYIVNETREVAISKNFTLTVKDKEKESVLKSLRAAIYPIIQEKKAGYYKGILCEITGEPINSRKDLHIDHHNLDFIQIVEAYLKLNNTTYKDLFKFCNKVGTVWTLNNELIIHNFTEFHNDNTHLRFTSATANLKKPKTK